MRVSGVKSNTSSSKIPQKYCKNKTLSYLYKLIAPPIPEFHCKITAKICRKIDKVNCADSASFILQRVSQMVTKWLPSGHQVVTKWSPSGPQVVNKWSPSGPQVVTKWSSSGHQVVTK